MDWEKYNLKDVFRLRIRICLLFVLIIFILGFFFSPEVKIEREEVVPDEPPFEIIPLPPDEIVTVKEIPTDIKNAIDKNLKEEYKNKEPVTEKPSDDNNKEPRVEESEDVIFYAYEVPPIPLNLDEVNFEYPKAIRMLGVEGVVYLQLLIDKKGDVKNVLVLDSLHPTLDKIAIQNVWKLEFSPAQQRDKSVSVYYSFPVEFKLE